MVFWTAAMFSSISLSIARKIYACIASFLSDISSSFQILSIGCCEVTADLLTTWRKRSYDSGEAIHLMILIFANLVASRLSKKESRLTFDGIFLVQNKKKIKTSGYCSQWRLCFQSNGYWHFWDNLIVPRYWMLLGVWRMSGSSFRFRNCF